MKFSISILAMNGLETTKSCIESVVANSKDYELILTDNGSSDGTSEFLRSIPNAIVIRNNVNQGFQEPNKKALSIAKGQYFILLNNDAVVPKGWLDEIEKAFASGNDVAIVGPTGMCSELDNQFHGKPGKLEYIEGSCLAVKVDVARKIGLFSDYLYFAYGEDSDLCLRAKEAGYSIKAANFTITHKRSQSSRNIPFIKAVQEANHHTLRHRWNHYINLRRIDHPIIIKRKHAIGDVLLTTPIIRELKKQKPLSKIHVWTDFPELFNGNPNVEKAWVDKPMVGNAAFYNLDMCYENLPMTPITTAYARACGIEEFTNKLEFNPSKEDFKWAEANIRKDTIAIHPGPTTWAGKNWLESRWAELEGKLSKHHNITRFGDGGIKTTIGQMGAAFSISKMVICLDSLPLHIAQAMGCKVVALFGATLPEYIMTNGPAIGIKSDESIPCSGERHRKQGVTSCSCDGECMKSITVKDVLKAVRELL